ncbi:hypothetical protein T265_10166 [Opisthorchis viverrini]|uniref:Uncharacterized protein n=1 Tax=Opisthorchis viverrini TaxID=6198 RepID=A0A074Z3E9_OPIVI|nr:hypothetical protein T265_10166 [Opisthorchis viverrini]KER21543.1 hypothetical protein T265_10166 [Opisthorchis viverrini]
MMRVAENDGDDDDVRKTGVDEGDEDDDSGDPNVNDMDVVDNDVDGWEWSAREMVKLLREGRLLCCREVEYAAEIVGLNLEEGVCHFREFKDFIYSARTSQAVALSSRQNYPLHLTSLQQWHRPDSGPSEMGDARVLLEDWRACERNMAQRNRETLPAGRIRPPHEVSSLVHATRSARWKPSKQS